MRTTLLFIIFIAIAASLNCSRDGAISANNAQKDTAKKTEKAVPDWPDSLDAVAAAPNNHKVVLENEKVRVLDVSVTPGEKEPLHGHKWPSVLHVMTEGDIRDYDANGKIIYDTKTDPNPMKAPYTIYMEPQAPHAVENLSKETLRLLRVELKQ